MYQNTRPRLDLRRAQDDTDLKAGLCRDVVLGFGVLKIASELQGVEADFDSVLTIEFGGRSQ